MQIDSDIPLGGLSRFACMETHPRRHTTSFRPEMCCQSPLCVCSCGNRIRRTRKNVKEGISLCIYLSSTVGGKGRSQQRAVGGQDLAVAPIAEVLKEACAFLDVREQQ